MEKTITRTSHLDTVDRLSDLGIDLKEMSMAELLRMERVVARVIWDTFAQNPDRLQDTLRELYDTLVAQWRVKLDELETCFYESDEEFNDNFGLSKHEFLLKSRQKYLVEGAKDLDANARPW